MSSLPGTKDFLIPELLEIGVLLGALCRLSTLHSSICSNIGIKKGFVIIIVVKHKWNQKQQNTKSHILVCLKCNGLPVFPPRIREFKSSSTFIPIPPNLTDIVKFLYKSLSIFHFHLDSPKSPRYSPIPLKIPF